MRHSVRLTDRGRCATNNIFGVVRLSLLCLIIVAFGKDAKIVKKESSRRPSAYGRCRK